MANLARRSMVPVMHGRRLASEADIESVLNSGVVIWRRDLSMLIGRLADEAAVGPSHSRPPLSIEELRAYGLAIVIQGDGAPGREERALQALQTPSS